jgi:RNA polymerase sigma-54 factor
VELRRFFVGGIAAEGGGEVSRDAVLERVRAIVAAEDSSSPLSDGKISEILKKEGYRVARRTVAKYRGILGIGGTSERKKA